MIVSVTRLRLRSWRYLIPFARLAIASHRETAGAPGLRDARVVMDRRLTFWTVTRWDNDTSLLAWVRAGTHKVAMPKLAGWCDQASVARWESTEAGFPSWALCHDRMVALGRPSFVRNPAPGPIAGIRPLLASPVR